MQTTNSTWTTLRMNPSLCSYGMAYKASVTSCCFLLWRFFGQSATLRHRVSIDRVWWVTVINLLKVFALTPVSCMSTDHLEYTVWTLAARIFWYFPVTLTDSPRWASMVHCAVPATIWYVQDLKISFLSCVIHKYKGTMKAKCSLLKQIHIVKKKFKTCFSSPKFRKASPLYQHYIRPYVAIHNIFVYGIPLTSLAPI